MNISPELVDEAILGELGARLACLRLQCNLMQAERREATIRKFRVVRSERARQVAREVDHDNLDAIAKNYLTEGELQVLNRIVTLYIEYAELQALERKPMTMRDWTVKLDDFLRAGGRNLLDHAGTVSAESARAKAEAEYVRYRAALDSQPRAVDADFENAAKQVQKIPPPKRSKRPKP